MTVRRTTIAGAVCAAVLVGTMGTASAGPWFRPPKHDEVKPILPEGQSNPLIANGVAIGPAATTYASSGLGPAGANTAAPAGTPERYIDFPGGTLPPGVTITEAQAINALKQIKANLEAVGLTPRDVISMRAYLSNPPGADVADFNGWNRAYRQFFANVDLVTRQPVPVPLGSAAPAPPMYVNAARPSRAALEVENLPVAGWLVEVEVVAVYSGKKR
ncbi:hypothetical protein DPM19_27565 [Actinomadura craniellae]|uniref:RidA family protein n=1 Tax=Actinomadura craniellae TaxID=2231787 RepID=A0A365GZ45_9ACTN|nr:Rid family hydrolase [Actinomadura craniellae]RAY12097.1 hypothetical protein DPM19_27565 [Actinomadura craniellae]